MTGAVTFDDLSPLPVAALLSFLLSLGLVGLLVRLARRMGVYALPGARQSHRGAVPTGGGIGIVLALSAVSWGWFPSGVLPEAWARWILPGALVMSALGWLDDRRPVSPLLRFIVQLAVSFGLLALLHQVGLNWSWLVMLMGGIMLVWLMNLYNFMDGSHGMAGFEGVFAATAVAVFSWAADDRALALACATVAAACAGFLPWNFPRPKIFMGDAGSVPLGFMLGGLVLLAIMQSVLTVPMAALVLSVFLVDSTLTLLRRVIRGERWYTPHRQHVYQRLIAHGWPHGRVLLVYQAINFGVVVPALVLAKKDPVHAWFIAIVIALLMSAGWYAASSRLEMRK